MALCSVCKKELGKEFNWLDSKSFKNYKFKCEDCMIEETIDKANSDPVTFKNIYNTMKSMEKVSRAQWKKRKERKEKEESAL